MQRWELALFGAQVSRVWWQAAPSALWSTVLHGAYFSYYFIVSVPAFYFLWRGDLAAVRRFVLAVMTTFVLCYLVFIFFPVAGPYYVFPRPADWFLANPAARLVYDTLAEGSSYGAAFPSSHVAATVAAAWPPPGLPAPRPRAARADVLLDRGRGVLPDALRGGRAGRACGRWSSGRG